MPTNYDQCLRGIDWCYLWLWAGHSSSPHDRLSHSTQGTISSIQEFPDYFSGAVLSRPGQLVLPRYLTKAHANGVSLNVLKHLRPEHCLQQYMHSEHQWYLDAVIFLRP